MLEQETARELITEASEKWQTLCKVQKNVQAMKIAQTMLTARHDKLKTWVGGCG